MSEKIFLTKISDKLNPGEFEISWGANDVSVMSVPAITNTEQISVNITANGEEFYNGWQIYSFFGDYYNFSVNPSTVKITSNIYEDGSCYYFNPQVMLYNENASGYPFHECKNINGEEIQITGPITGYYAKYKINDNLRIEKIK